MITSAGAVIFIIAFFGCCGAWRESPWMIYTYAAFLCVILTGKFSPVPGSNPACSQPISCSDTSEG
jgi:hypothetical protein